MSASRADRPNILWFVSEDCSPHGPAYGDYSTATPTIERLARQGIVFENAFCTVPVCAPSRFSILTGMYPTTCGPAHNMEAVAHLPETVKTYPELAHANGYHCTNNSKTHYNCDVDPGLIWDESGPSAHWRDRPEGAPFLAVFNCLETHESVIFDADHGDGDDDGSPLPVYLPDDPAVRGDRGRLRRAVERMDREFGALLTELAEDGLAEDTIVVYASDHGGSLPRSKRYCYDEGLRVPLIVRVPRRWAHLSRWGPGSRVTEAVSLIDVAPTMVTLTGGTPPPTMAGQALFGTEPQALRGYAFGSRDRMDERYDMVRTVRDARFRYIRNYRPDRIHGQHYAYAWTARSYQVWERAHGAGTLNATQDTFWHPKASEELYDTSLDPDQVVNLASSADHADDLRRLRRALDEHLVACVDNGFLPEEHHLQGLSPSGRPHDVPITDLMAVAGMAIRRDVRNLPSLIRLADDDQDYVRYWAAIGMSMLPADLLDKEAVGALDRLMTDECASVRVEAAEVAARTSSANLAVRVLGEELGHSRTDLTRLRALNALTDAGPPAAVHLERITELSDADDEYVRGAARYLRLMLTGEYTPESEIFAWDRYKWID